MKRETTHEIRALLLASLMVLSVVGGAVGAVGSVGASTELDASDGEGGTYSFLFANFTDELPEGEQSADDTLQVETAQVGETLDNNFYASVNLKEGSDVEFNTDQSTDDVEAVVYNGATEEEIRVDDISSKRVDLAVEYDGSTFDDGPQGIRVNNLSFDTGSAEEATLTWTLEESSGDSTASYVLNVTDFQTGVVATDEEGGDSASLTAGAANQTMVSDDGANNPVLQGNDSSASFPEYFEATLSLEGQNVSFHEANEAGVSAVSPNGDAEVVDVGSDQVVVSVSGYEPPTTTGNYDIVELQGLTYDVPSDANSETLSWSVGDVNDSYTLTAERLEAGIEGNHEFPRGLDRQPEAEDDLSDDGITLTVNASGKNTNGFHDADREFYVFIPEAHQGDLEFDRSSDPNGTLSTDTSLEESNVLVNVRDENTLWVTLPEDMDGGETLTISGVTFNTTGIAESEIGESDFESGLDVEYEPVDSLDRLERSTGSDALNVTVPKVVVEGDSTAFAPKQNIEGANGTDELAVKVQDVTGGQMAGDEDIVISLAGDDAITFNQSQELVAKNNIDGDGRRKVDVSPYEIRIRGDDIFSDTSKDEYHKLEAENGTGIKFDVDAAAAGSSANLTVRTSPSDASVTQLTETVVTVEPANMTVDPERLRAHGSENETITVEVNEPGDVSAEGVEVSVDTAELPEGVSLPESATTDGDGKATFDLERNTNETVTLEFAANASDIDGAQKDLTEEVKVVAPGLFPNTETIPVGQESEVEVTVKRFDDKSGQLEPVGNGNVTVFADGDNLSDDSETTAETDANGVATFTLNATDESEIEFTADVDEVEVNDDISAVRAEIDTSQRTLPVGDSDPVKVTVVNVTQEGDKETISGVDVYATSDDIDLNVDSPKNTGDDGSVTFDFDLQEVGVIELNTTLDDGTELDAAVQTVDIGTNVSKIPAGKETTVAVEVDGSEGVDVDGGTVTATSDAIEDRSTDIDNGVATFTFAPGNDENATIDFETTVDDAELETSVVSVAPRLKTDPGAINLGAEEDVTVTVEAFDAENGEMVPRDVSVAATSDEYDVDDEQSTGGDGRTTFTIDLTDEDESGSITFDASVNGIPLSETVAAEHFDVGVSGGPVTEGESGTLIVSITPSGESAEGFTVVAAGDPLDEPVEAEDVGDGEYELTLTPDASGEITVNVEELGETRVVEVEEASSGSAGGGGGGGFYGGGGGALPADISVVDASLAATETVVDEPVEVTVMLRNDGGGDGTYDVRVGDGIRTYGSETVDVGAGETVEIVVEAVFPNSGEFDLVVDDVEVGTVVVKPATDEPDIENAAALDTRPVEDAASDEPGVTVEFEDVTVESITFGSDADGSATVADLEALPADVPAAPGSLVRPMEIRVPDELSDEPATVRFSVSLVDIDGDMDHVALARYTDGGWESYQPEVVETRGDEVVYEVETPGFSTFAVYEQHQQDPEDPSAPATPDEDVEESGFVGPLGMMIIAFVALLAVLLAVAGARVYKESGP